METSHPAPPRPNPAPITDLKVTVHDTAIIPPPPPSPNQPGSTSPSPVFLSNIDQLFNHYTRTLCFFPANPSHGWSASSVVETLRRAVGESLQGPFRFLAGRLKRNEDDDRLEIDLGGALGVEFLVAESEFSLEEIGDLALPHPAYDQQLVVTDLNRGDSKLLLAFQVTKFKCGGFCVGTCYNHVCFDGIGFIIYAHCVAALAANQPLPVTPCTDRTLLAARSPPRTTFSPEEFRHDMPPAVTQTRLDVGVFHISALEILKLKQKAQRENDVGESKTDHSMSVFNVVTALVWTCKALSVSDPSVHPDRVSRVCFPVNARSKLSPPLPETYAGNGIVMGHAAATCGELGTLSFGAVVGKVAEAAAKVDDEYARSFIDWVELRRGHGRLWDCVVSDMRRLGMEKVRYPWGRPKHFCRVDYGLRYLIMLLEPRVEDAGDGGGGKEAAAAGRGVCFQLSLPPDQMVKFKELLHRFLEK